MHARIATVLLTVLAATVPTTAHAVFPWNPDGQPAGAGQAPADISGKETWMYAATPEAGNEPNNSSPYELDGVRGASLTDAADVDQAFRTTTGRPDVVIAVHDSGIEWDDLGAMKNLRFKTRINPGEVPTPNVGRATAIEDGVNCATFTAVDDADGNGVFNIRDFACDTRVEKDGAARVANGQPRGNGRDELLDPQDVLIAFSLGEHKGDGDTNGYADDIVGWDFLDDDNDPYDDVGYGHGTGEANDSLAEAANGQDGVGTCPNCLGMHIRVGDSFVADVNRFAQGVIYSVDSGALVVQEALGALNNSRLAREAVEYAHRKGVTIIASAADEAAQHHHWPESYPHVIVVNSVTKYNTTFSPAPKSYLQFTGCTNFGSKIDLAIPSVSCSSDATGRAAGMAGLIHSAALDAREANTIGPAPTAGCQRIGGAACAVTADEVRQLMASGTVAGAPLADDVNFAMSELSCNPAPLPACTDPQANTILGANGPVVSPLVQTRRYPSKAGHDQFYGYGRVNMNSAVDALTAGRIPPEVAITSPDWFANIDPTQPAAGIGATIDSRAAGGYTCKVLVAPGSYPNNAEDFEEVPSTWCDGTTVRTTRFDGQVAVLNVADLKAQFPSTAGDFQGREPGIGAQTAAGRPNTEPYGFIVRVEATATVAGSAVKGEDRRNLYLHRDQDMLEGWPRRIGGGTAGSGDVESSPLFADLDGDNRNELVITGSDGLVHAYRRDGSEAPGWPAKTDRLPLHDGSAAFTSGAVDDDARGAVLASLAAGDLDRDGFIEVVAADLEGKIYVFGDDGSRERTLEANPDYSGKPLSPFVPERVGELNRTQHGFIASPVLADVDRNDGGRLEIVAASMDRHVYLFDDDGTLRPGFPRIAVDPTKVASIDPQSHRVTFKSGVGASLQQGAIIDTPAVGDIASDDRPEIVVGTNEEYVAGEDGGFHSAPVNAAAISLLEGADILSLANSRLYAITADGDYVDGWPAKVGKVFAELLPVVGEGITGAPVIGPVANCPNAKGKNTNKVGVVPDGGPAMVLNADTTSCVGQAGGKPIGMQSDVPDGNPVRADIVTLPAVGHPAFGNFDGGVSFMVPTTGIFRALDLAVNEYQGGEDSYSAWDPATGQFRPGFPQRNNDLSFLTGPVVGDIGGLPGEEMIGGTAYLDLQAFSAGGAPPSDAWPKLTGDWMVANPLLGSFGQDELDAGSRKAVIAATRDGRINAFGTEAGPCSPSSWPRFHHDNHNSGDYGHDGAGPGAPIGLTRTGSSISFRSPGDDLLCGTPKGYEIADAESGTPSSWRTLEVLAAAAGATVETRLPAGTRRVVSIRAVDEQGNVGRPVTVSAPEGTPPVTDPPAPASTTPAPGSGNPTCTDRVTPLSRFAKGGVRATRRAITVRGTSADRGCGGRLARVAVAIGRRTGSGCRFLTAKGRFGAKRSCLRTTYVPVKGTATWSLTLKGRFPKGRYVVWARAIDRARNIETKQQSRNFRRFTLRR